MFLKNLCVKDIPVAINTMVMGAESFCCYTADGSYHFYVTDHLGNVRAVTDASGTIEKTFDYYPFGESYESVASANPGQDFRYGGKQTENKFGNREVYDFSARWYSPVFGRFQTMDPLCEKYYSLSPYAYCANNPMNVVDPSGKDIWVYDIRGRQSAKYLGGNLYDANGDVYETADAFMLAVQSVLNDLLSLGDDYITEVIKSLEKSDNKHMFVYNPGYKDSVKPVGEYGESDANKGIPVSTWIKLSFSHEDLSFDGIIGNKETIIAHELKHSFDYDQGLYKENNTSMKGIDSAEVSAVNFENRVRARRSLPLQRKYNNIVIPKSKLENPFSKKHIK